MIPFRPVSCSIRENSKESQQNISEIYVCSNYSEWSKHICVRWRQTPKTPTEYKTWKQKPAKICALAPGVQENRRPQPIRITAELSYAIVFWAENKSCVFSLGQPIRKKTIRNTFPQKIWRYKSLNKFERRFTNWVWASMTMWKEVASFVIVQ